MYRRIRPANAAMSQYPSSAPTPLVSPQPMPARYVEPAVPRIVPAPTFVETTVNMRKRQPMVPVEVSQPSKSTRDAQ